MKFILNKKKLSIVVVIFVAMTTVIGPCAGMTDNVYAGETPQAAESSADSWRYEDGQMCVEEKTPDLKNLKGNTPPAWSEVDGKFYSSNGKVIDGAIAKGIDVSYWNGKDTPIDWEKVKNDGITFVILRCGYGNNLKKYDDSTFEYNASECERLGIPYGVYLYSYADSVDDATSEANHVLRLIKNHKLSYPVYYDLEDSTTAGMGRANIIKTAIKFCDIIEDNGYTAGIYANLNWWNNKLNDTRLDKYEKWVAQYNSTCTYKKEYRIWQSTSSGKVDGINTKNVKVDLNFEFDLGDGKYASATYKKGWNTDENGKKYYIGKGGKRLTGYYKIGNYYYLFGSDGIMRKGTAIQKDKKYILASNGRSTRYTARTKDALNYRSGAGASYKLKGTFKKGTLLYVVREKNGWGQLKNGYWVNLKYTKKVKTYPVFIPYKVKTTEILNYRSGPGTSYKVKGTFKKGATLNIVASKNGWGKTKSGYWVKLEYTKRI